MKILVVDSYTVSAEKMARMLRPDHQIRTASDSPSAMLSVCRDRPAVVLLRPDRALVLAQRMLKAMHELGDLKLIVHEGLTKEDADRLLTP